MTIPSQDDVAFLRVLGIVALVFSWIPVFRPEIKVVWKGGNRAPMSQRSKLAAAFALTAWCMLAFGVAAWLGTILCTAGGAALLVFGQQDRERHAAETGIRIARPINPKHLWVGLCAIDVFLLSCSLYAFVRDHYLPQATNERALLHSAVWGYVMMSLAATFLLYRIRPRKDFAAATPRACSR